MFGKSEKAEEKETAVQGMHMGWDEKKELYLKYFPAPSERKDSKECSCKRQEELGTADGEEVCIFCGNIHVRQYNQREIFICEDCRKQFISQRQEIFETIIQTQRSLEGLFNITLHKTPVLQYKEKWYKKILRQYRFDYNDEKDPFGFRKEWAEVDKREDEIVFNIYRGIPRTVLMLMAAVYMLDSYVDDEASGMLDLMIGIWKPLNRNTLMKWCGIHYMYLNGYTNFSSWQDRAVSRNKSYGGWCQLLGSPIASCHFTIPVLEDKLRRKRKVCKERERFIQKNMTK